MNDRPIVIKQPVWPKVGDPVSVPPGITNIIIETPFGPFLASVEPTGRRSTITQIRTIKGQGPKAIR